MKRDRLPIRICEKKKNQAHSCKRRTQLHKYLSKLDKKSKLFLETIKSSTYLELSEANM